MSDHELKTAPGCFDALGNGKDFELRKDDRSPPFESGDRLLLREWGTGMVGYTGRKKFARVVYTLRDHVGLDPGYVILGIRVLS